jgi:regulator of CtrA degradation
MKRSCVSKTQTKAPLLSFGDRFTRSPQFAKLYREGMDLVDRTAEYLDGAGRRESKALTPPSSQAYTSESIKLTTRLTQLASWLLVRRALVSGEITPAEVRNHRNKVNLVPQSQAVPEGFDGLPEMFKALIAHSHRLHERIVRLERLLSEGYSELRDVESPVDGHIERIRLEFPAA